MSILSRFRILAVAAALGLAPLATAVDHGIDADGVRYASWRGEARVGDATSPAELRLLCKPGAGGALGWTLLIERPERLAEFDFAAFDGPSAPARGQELATLGLRGGVLAPTVDTAVNGSRRGDGRFAFAFASEANAASGAALIADAIGPATNRLTWVVSQLDEEAELLRADFDLTGSARAASEAMAGCGPIPPLPLERIVAWQVSGASVAEVVGDRAVTWRLRAAAGRDWPEVQRRIARLGPWRVDGRVLHAVAEGPDPLSGAALLIAAESDAVEILLIDDGRVRRLVGGSATLDPPPAIREFVERRTASPDAGRAAPQDDADDSAADAEPPSD
jgi:hypothetical protein